MGRQVTAPIKLLVMIWRWGTNKKSQQQMGASACTSFICLRLSRYNLISIILGIIVMITVIVTYSNYILHLQMIFLYLWKTSVSSRRFSRSPRSQEVDWQVVALQGPLCAQRGLATACSNTGDISHLGDNRNNGLFIKTYIYIYISPMGYLDIFGYIMGLSINVFFFREFFGICFLCTWLSLGLKCWPNKKGTKWWPMFDTFQTKMMSKGIISSMFGFTHRFFSQRCHN